jgi:exopolyphosphatase/guanosine-5'-triphosphate,3'-diphosphate pyrophosphatase
VLTNEAETAARTEILALMHQLEARPIHVQHVARLALQLFDGLAALHGLGPRERLLLEAAGYLHDIGHQYDFLGLGHHKESARLIREQAWKNLDRADVELIAQIARYHRKAMPDFTHEEFRALSEADRAIVQCLAGLLRLGDSLDRSHAQVISGLTVELRPGQVALHLEATGPIVREVSAAQIKADLAMLVFQRDFLFLSGGKPVELPQAPSSAPGQG